MIIDKIFQDKDFDALNQTTRWNGKRVIKTESVAEHTNMVALFARFLAEEIYEGSSKYASKCLEIVTLALFHDLDEIFSGDVSHSLKYNKMNGVMIKNEIEKYVEFSLKNKFSTSSKSDQLVLNVLGGNQSQESHLIVKIADWLSMCYFLEREKSLGNSNILETLNYCEHHVRASAFAFSNYVQNEHLTKVNLTAIKQLIQWRR